MGIYEIGKDVERLTREYEIMQGLLQQLYAIVEHNLSNKKLDEPPKKKG